MFETLNLAMFLNCFLIFAGSQPHVSYKNVSYKKKRVISDTIVSNHISGQFAPDTLNQISLDLIFDIALPRNCQIDHVLSF